MQVHCVKAFPELQKYLLKEQSFEAGLVLHSWMGPQHMVAPLAAIPGVHFSISGHSLRSDSKAAAMLRAVGVALHCTWPSQQLCGMEGRRGSEGRPGQGYGMSTWFLFPGRLVYAGADMLSRKAQMRGLFGGFKG